MQVRQKVLWTSQSWWGTALIKHIDIARLFRSLMSYVSATCLRLQQELRGLGTGSRLLTGHLLILNCHIVDWN